MGQGFRRKVLVGNACAAALLLAGCATTLQYPPFPDQAKRVEDPAKARVYLIRPPGSVMGDAPLVFYGNDWGATGPVFDPTLYSSHYDTARAREVGEVGPASYICWETPPHEFRIQRIEGHTNSVYSTNLIAGNVYYLRATAHFSWTRPTSIVEMIPENEGLLLLKKCQPPNSYRKVINHENKEPDSK
jgi:hypothetical protein